MSLAAGTRLGPYEILSPLGAGGMGEVYRAKDTKLDREVAIKVLPADVASSPERLQRFEREAKTVAALNHPNIVTIHGIHNEDDHRFIAMELVEGETLDRMIAPGGMPLAKIFDIAIPLADALTAAHDKGIVHRDLKPANVMLTKEGRVKVLDFGLAKLAAAGQGGSAPDDVTMSAPLTGKGMIIGTVPYMSPEQLKSDSLDHRTDLFSLGVMLYEMATGQRPFKGEKSAEVMSSILRDTPRPLHELNGVLPRHLGRVVARCLKKDPEERYQTAKDVRNELRELKKEVDSDSDFEESQFVSAQTSDSPSPSSNSGTSLSGSALSAPTRRGEFWIGVGVIAIILVAGFWYMRTGSDSATTIPRTGLGSDSSPIDSLAVLPFANVSGDAEADFLSDGIAESVINSLITIPQVRVVSRNTAFRHRGRENELHEVARELEVRSVLTGRVLKRGDRLVVSVSLEDMDSHEQLWGERFDRELNDILSLEREISGRITRALRLTVNESIQDGRDKSDTEHPEARLAYMQGRFFWNKRTLHGFNKSLEQYDRAIALDPGYALAYAGKATTYVMMGWYTHPPKEVNPLAKQAAEKAIQLAPELAEAYTPLAWLHVMGHWDWDAAEQTFLKAIALNPRYETAHHWYGILLCALGRFDQAETELGKALRIDPESMIIRRDHALPAIYRRDITLAEKRLDFAFELYPNSLAARYWYAPLRMHQRRYDEAIAFLREVEASGQSNRMYEGLLGYALGLAGRRSEALQELNRLTEAAQNRYVPATAFGMIYAGLGDLDRAFEYFDEAVEDQSGYLFSMKFSPLYDPLRHDPRFDRLLERIRIPSQPPAPGLDHWEPKPVSLAILPFKNVSEDPDTDFLSNEIPASIIDKMTGLSGLNVVSRSGAFRFDPAKGDASTFGRDLGASVVLTGQLNARSDSLTIRAELVDVATNQQLWSKRYPRELSDIVAVEAEIVRSISDALRIQLSSTERTHLTTARKVDPDAYRSFLQGRFWWNKFTAEGTQTALRHFEKALERDPGYAPAYAELANTYVQLGNWFGSMAPREAFPKAKAAAVKALELDPTLAEAHRSLGFMLFVYEWDWRDAEREFKRAIELAPNSPSAHSQYGVLLHALGRFDEANREREQALELDPLSPILHAAMAWSHIDLGEHVKAVERFEEALKIDASFPPAFLGIGYTYLSEGRFEDAIVAFEHAARGNGRKNYLGWLGIAHAKAGQLTEALAILGELERLSTIGHGRIQQAILHAALGNVERAFDFLEIAYREHESELVWINTILPLDNLRSDPRFDDLLQRIGLKPNPRSVSSQGAKREKTMLAVLPFTNLSGDPEQEYFSDGMTEEMITRLGRLRPDLLGVIARTSAMRYKQTDKLIDQIGRELGVDYVIEGGVRRSGNSVRISAQLIQVSDQTQIWGDGYTRDLADVFAVQAEVAEAVAKSLAVELLPQAEMDQEETPTDSSEAYDAYLLGRSYWAKRTPEALHTAIGHFERAVQMDPGYALAYSGLADAWGVLPYYKHGDFSAMRAQAEKYATKAVALDGSLAETNVSMASVRSERRDLEGALPFYRKAIALDANNATARQWHGLALCLLGRGDEGVAEFEHGVSLDPMSPVLRLDFGVGLMHVRRFEEAIEQLDNALELQPEFGTVHDDLLWSFVGLDRPDDAARVFEEYLHLLGQPAESARKFRDAYADSGLCGAIMKWLSSIPANAEIPNMNTGIQAALHAMCGDASRAFELLDQALEKQDPEVLYVSTLPAYDKLRDDPRFNAFLRKAGLPKIEIPNPQTIP